MKDDIVKNAEPEISQKISPRGYWFVLAIVTDKSQFGNYTAVAGPVIASYGGRVLARGDVAVVVEGSLPGRPFLVEFPSYSEALDCFNSSIYQEAIALRDGAAQFSVVIAEGFQAGTVHQQIS